MTIAEELKQEGIQRVSEHHPDWHEWAVREIVRLADAYFEIDADMLRESCVMFNRVPPHPNSLGAAFNTASRQGKILLTGYRRSRHKAGHARIISTWKRYGTEMDRR